LIDFYRKQSMDAQQIEQGLRLNSLISDRRLSDYLLTLEDISEAEDAFAADQQDAVTTDG
jgi:hypothetical protein